MSKPAILDNEEKWIEAHLEEFVPVKNQNEVRTQLKQAAVTTAEKNRKKTDTINFVDA